MSVQQQQYAVRRPPPHSSPILNPGQSTQDEVLGHVQDKDIWTVWRAALRAGREFNLALFCRELKARRGAGLMLPTSCCPRERNDEMTNVKTL